jgi:transcription termination factor Rho
MMSRLSCLLALIIALPILPYAQAADSRFGLSDKFGGSLPKAATVRKSRSNSDRDRNDRNDRNRNDRDDRDRNDRDDRDRDSRNDRDRGPRVVGRREPVRAFGPTLSKQKSSKKSEKNHAAEQMKRTATTSLGLRTYSSRKTHTSVPIRVTGTVGKTTVRKGEREFHIYFLESGAGRVPISAESFSKGGVKLGDLESLVDRRIRLTGNGFFQDEARKQPRFKAISKIEYDRSQSSGQ